MTTVSRKDLKWKVQTLMYGDKVIASYGRDEEYPGMFWVYWPEGDRSETFYNLTRAKEHCFRIALKQLNEEGDDEE